LLARQCKLSGDNHQHSALAAAFLAVEEGGMVTMTPLIQTTDREYQQRGKSRGAAELSSFVSEVTT
jgi:hypothetical protein